MARAPRMAKTISPISLKTVDSVFDEIDRMQEAITRRAYELFERAGCCEGRELEDWLRAELEMTWSPPIELSEKNGELSLEVAVAGFEPKDLDVRITPQDILIQSERIHQDSEEEQKVHRCEFRHGKLFRDVRLPRAINTKRAKAQYRNGMLQITAPIAEEESRSIPITEA